MTNGFRTKSRIKSRPGIRSAKLRAVELATAVKPVLPVAQKVSYWSSLTGWVRSLGAYLMNVGR
jgi:hypothetical protein